MIQPTRELNERRPQGSIASFQFDRYRVEVRYQSLTEEIGGFQFEVLAYDALIFGNQHAEQVQAVLSASTYGEVMLQVRDWLSERS